jgi:uncharacterized protein YggE
MTVLGKGTTEPGSKIQGTRVRGVYVQGSRTKTERQKAARMTTATRANSFLSLGKGNQMYRSLVFIVCAIAMVSAKEKELDQFIKVEGNGIVYSMPTYAVVSIGVADVNKVADSAQARVASVCSDMFSLCRKLRIDSLQIKTDKYSINKKFKYNKDREEEFVGYEVIVRYNIRINRIAVVDTFLASSVLLGSNAVESVNFMAANQDSLTRLAQDLAMKDALKNAEAILKSTGRKPGALIKATDDWHGNFDISSNIFVNVAAPEFAKGGTLGADAPRKPVFIKVIPAEIKIAEKVHAIFEIK